MKQQLQPPRHSSQLLVGSAGCTWSCVEESCGATYGPTVSISSALSKVITPVRNSHGRVQPGVTSQIAVLTRWFALRQGFRIASGQRIEKLLVPAIETVAAIIATITAISRLNRLHLELC